MYNRCMIPEMIAIAGPTSTGKTTLRKTLLSELTPHVLVHTYDAYDVAPTEEALGTYLEIFGNPPHWEGPFVYDNDAYVEDMERLSRGETVVLYDRSRESLQQMTLVPKKYVIVEGILTWWDPRVVELFSKRIYLDLSTEKMVQRRLQRPRNPTLISHQPSYIMGPMLVGTRDYILPQRNTATHIVNADQLPHDVAMHVLNIITEGKATE